MINNYQQSLSLATNILNEAKKTTRTIPYSYNIIQLIQIVSKDPFFQITQNNNTPKRLYHILHYLILSTKK